MIYLDNAATSWPKPPTVLAAMQSHLKEPGNAGRGGHTTSIRIGQTIFQTREKIATLFGVEDPTKVIFTGNATQAINQVLFGLLKPGDHIITTSLEHNAVTRPLHVLKQKGITVSEVKVPVEGQIDMDSFKKQFQKSTKLLVSTHASNVTGTVLPIRELGALAHANGALFMVDAAQTAGVFDINIRKDNIDFLAFPGHKGLLGPQGTGGLILEENEIQLEPIMYGGTGSLSELDEQPDFYPDRLESGTLNSVGIAGLGAAVEYLSQQGLNLKHIREKEQMLCQRLIDGLLSIPGVTIYGGVNAFKKAPIVAFNLKEIDSIEIGFALDRLFGIQVRAGLQCAPHAHRTLGTIEQGVVRLSPSHVTSLAEIDTTLEAIKKIAEND